MLRNEKEKYQDNMSAERKEMFGLIVNIENQLKTGCTTLTLSGQSISNISSAIVVANYIVKNITIKNVDLANTSLTGKALETLCKELKKATHVEMINLSENSFSAGDAVYIRDLLKDNNGLEDLFIYKNNFNESDLKGFSDVLKNNHELLGLDLAENARISKNSESMKEINDYLKRNKVRRAARTLMYHGNHNKNLSLLDAKWCVDRILPYAIEMGMTFTDACFEYGDDAMGYDTAGVMSILEKHGLKKNVDDEMEKNKRSSSVSSGAKVNYSYQENNNNNNNDNQIRKALHPRVAQLKGLK